MTHLKLIILLVSITNVAFLGYGTVDDILLLLKQYAHPYENFNAIDRLCNEIVSELELIQPNQLHEPISHYVHLKMQMNQLYAAVMQLQQNRQELRVYLFEDLNYLRNVICGIANRYKQVRNELLPDELRNILQLSEQGINEILRNHDEVIQ